MSDFTHDTAFMRDLDPSGKLEIWAKSFMASLNNAAKQVNASPVGVTDPPPQISALNVTGGGSIHRIAIQDNNPINRGVNYHVEWDVTPQFTSPKQITMGPDRNKDLQLGINGPVYFRAYSSHPTSAPSDPVYFGTQSSPVGVSAGNLSLSVAGVTAGAATVTAVGAVVGPPPLPSAGTGTEPSQFPQGSAGFGFDPTRGGSPGVPALNASPRLPE